MATIRLQKPADLCWAPEIEGNTFVEQNDDDESYQILSLPPLFLSLKYSFDKTYVKHFSMSDQI